MLHCSRPTYFENVRLNIVIFKIWIKNTKEGVKTG